MARAIASREIKPEPAHVASCAEYMKVLADETRLAVVRQLLAGPRHVHEINSELHIEATLLSHHLRVLREGGIVLACRDGRSLVYRLSPQVRLAQRGRILEFGCCRLSFPSPVGREKPHK